MTGMMHDSRILVRMIYSPKFDFSVLASGKYYLVDLGFTHRPGYMAPFKGSDISYHFQQLYDNQMGCRQNFHNTCEKFNFRYSLCRNVIKRAFGV